MRIPLQAVAAAAVLMVAQAGPAAAKPTGETGYQINAAHDGRVVFKKPFTGPLKMKWSRDLASAQDGILSYPFAANGIVFTTIFLNSGAQLYALDEQTGNTLWHKTVSNQAFARATYDKGVVFVVSGSGFLQAFTADSVGTPLWHVQLPGSNSFEGPPTAYKGKIYLATFSTTFVVDQKTGAYKIYDGEGGYSALAAGPDGAYLSLGCEQVKFALKTLKVLWTYNDGCGGSGDFPNPSYFNGRLYGQGQNSDVVLNADTGDFVQTFSAVYPPAFWTPRTGNPIAITGNLDSIDTFDTVTGNGG